MNIIFCYAVQSIEIFVNLVSIIHFLVLACLLDYCLQITEEPLQILPAAVKKR